MNPKLLKVATFYLYFYIPTFFITVLLLIGLSSTFGDSPIFGAISMLITLILIPLHLIAFIDLIFVFFYYLINCFKNSKVPEDKRILWALGVFFAWPFVIPFYWSKFIK